MPRNRPRALGHPWWCDRPKLPPGHTHTRLIATVALRDEERLEVCLTMGAGASVPTVVILGPPEPALGVEETIHLGAALIYAGSQLEEIVGRYPTRMATGPPR